MGSWDNMTALCVPEKNVYDIFYRKKNSERKRETLLTKNVHPIMSPCTFHTAQNEWMNERGEIAWQKKRNGGGESRTKWWSQFARREIILNCAYYFMLQTQLIFLFHYTHRAAPAASTTSLRREKCTRELNKVRESIIKLAPWKLISFLKS